MIELFVGEEEAVGIYKTLEAVDIVKRAAGTDHEAFFKAINVIAGAIGRILCVGQQLVVVFFLLQRSETGREEDFVDLLLT